MAKTGPRAPEPSEPVVGRRTLAANVDPPHSTCAPHPPGRADHRALRIPLSGQLVLPADLEKRCSVPAGTLRNVAAKLNRFQSRRPGHDSKVLKTQTHSDTPCFR